jgi:hypothetical protein
LQREIEKTLKIDSLTIRKIMIAAERVYNLFLLFGDNVFRFPYIFNTDLINGMTIAKFKNTLAYLQTHQTALKTLFNQQ